MSPVHYREATKTDIPAMARLRAASWGTEDYWNTRIAAYLASELDPRQALQPRVGYVAVEGDSVVGLIAGHLTRRHQCDGELEWIEVVAECRGTGVAAGLLGELAKWFVAQKAARICVDVQPSNTVARRFYARHGAGELNPHWMVWEDIKVVLSKP